MSELTLPNIKARPAQISRATGLLVANLVVVLFFLVLRYVQRSVLPHGFVFLVCSFIFLYAFEFFLIWKIYEGRNWARITFVAIVGLALVGSPITARHDHRSRFDKLRSGLHMIVNVYAAFLICTSPGKEWFSEPRPDNY